MTRTLRFRPRRRSRATCGKSGTTPRFQILCRRRSPPEGRKPAGATTTSSSTTASSTPTTTLPAGCADLVTLAAVACRVGGLTNDVDAKVPAGKIRTKLDAKLTAAAAQITKAEALVAQGKTKPAKSAVKRALAAVRAVAKRIRSHAARKVIDGGTVTTLGAAADRIAGELSPLRKAPA